MNLHPLFLCLHVLSVAVWVGGMFFAYVCLRPAALEVLEPPQRLRLWAKVFARFFVWVWLAVLLIPASGLFMFAANNASSWPWHWYLMLATGSLMIVIFLLVVAAPYVALTRAVAEENWPAGGAALNRIRQLVGLNLILGILTIMFATLGRWLL